MNSDTGATSLTGMLSLWVSRKSEKRAHRIMEHAHCVHRPVVNWTHEAPRIIRAGIFISLSRSHHGAEDYIPDRDQPEIEPAVLLANLLEGWANRCLWINAMLAIRYATITFSQMYQLMGSWRSQTNRAPVSPPNHTFAPTLSCPESSATRCSTAQLAQSA